MNTARLVNDTYKAIPLGSFKAVIGKTIQKDDFFFDSSIFFERFTFYSSQEYMGPYFYKDKDSIKETYMYSNAEFTYFTQDYYKNNKGLVKEDA